MWPLFSSTTMPSGKFPAWLTIVRKSDPSGLHDITRPPPASKKNSRAIVVWAAGFSAFELLTSGLIVVALLIAHLLKPLPAGHEGSRRWHEIRQFLRC